MISAADFPDIFPSMAEDREPRQQADTQYDSCLARWEDDGGRVHHRQSGGSSPSADPALARRVGHYPLKTDAVTPPRANVDYGMDVVAVLRICEQSVGENDRNSFA